MQRMNNSGDNEHPCRTPLSTENLSEKNPSFLINQSANIILNELNEYENLVPVYVVL